jgi:uncharacterized protein (DUF433 family)
MKAEGHYSFLPALIIALCIRVPKKLMGGTMGEQGLNLPVRLKQDAQEWATRQGVSLDEFVLWAVAEKVGALSQQLDDPNFPHIAYRRGAAGQPVPVVRGRGLRVQTIVVAIRQWEWSPTQVAEEYGLTEQQVQEALAFYADHQAEVDAGLVAERACEDTRA